MRSRKIITNIILFIAALAVLHSVGSSFVRTKLEEAVAQRLTRKLGPAESYQVNTDGSLLELLHGRMNGVHIIGKGVVLKTGFTVDRLDINASGITFDAARRTLKSVDKTDFSAYVTQARLNSYLTGNYEELASSTIKLEDGKLKFQANPEISDIPMLVDAEGVVKIQDGTKLIVSLQRVDTLGVNIPREAFRLLEKKINPLFDTSQWPVHARLESASIGDGKITVRGNAEFAHR